MVNRTTHGHIKEDEVWRGEIRITGDIIVEKGVTLTVEPDAKVLISANRDAVNLFTDPFDMKIGLSTGNPEDLNRGVHRGEPYRDEGNHISIRVHGTLHALGTPQQLITITSDSPTPTRYDWNMLQFDNGILSYAVVEYYRGLAPGSGTELSHSTLRHVGECGVCFYGGRSGLVEDNRIFDTGHEIIDMHHSAPVIRNNRLGPPCHKDGIIVDLSSPRIVGNTIEGCHWGVSFSNPPVNVIIENNAFINNEEDIKHFYTTAPTPVSTPTPSPTATVAPTSAPTPVSGLVVNRTTHGHIKEDEVWRGEIRIVGDIFVQPGVSLTIEPGTKVIVAANRDEGNVKSTDPIRTRAGINTSTEPIDDTGPGEPFADDNNRTSLSVFGTLHAVGTPERMITFTSDSPTPGRYDWGPFRIENGILSYAVVEYNVSLGAHHGTVVSHNILRHVGFCAVCLGSGTAVIEHNSIFDAGHELIDMHGSAPVIRSNRLGPNYPGNCVVVDRGSPTITGNTIEGCFHGTSFLAPPSDIIMENNTFINNEQDIRRLYATEAPTPTVRPEVVGTLLVGDKPMGVAVNPATNRIYVANSNRQHKDGQFMPVSKQKDTVSVIDGKSGRLIATIPVGGFPQGIAVHPTINRIYVANYEASTVSVIDGDTNIVIATVPVTKWPQEVAVMPRTNRVYVTHEQARAVTIIDGAFNKVVATLENMDSPQAVAVHVRTNRVYIVNGGQRRVTVLDGNSNAIIGTIEGVGEQPRGIAASMHMGRIYVANEGEGTVAAIDVVTNRVAFKTSVEGEPRRVAVDTRTELVYATDFRRNRVWVIHTLENPGVRTTVRAGGGPVGIAVNPVTGQAYAAEWQLNTVAVIGEPPSAPQPGPHVIATIKVGSNPDRLGLDPHTNRVYVPNTADATVSVIAGETNTVIATISAEGPVAAAVLPNIGRVYVPNKNGQVYVVDGRTNTIIATIPVGQSPGGIAANPRINRVYVTNRRENSVSVIDGAANAVIATISVGRQPRGVGVNPVTNRIYVANEIDEAEVKRQRAEEGVVSVEKGFVSVIDGSTNAVIANVPMGLVPKGVAVNPNTNRVYVTNWGESSVRVIDGATNQVIAVIPVTGTPFLIDVNPKTNRVYVGKEWPPLVSMIDGVTSTVVAEVRVGQGRSVAINPSTGRVYVADIPYDTVTVISDTLLPFSVTSTR